MQLCLPPLYLQFLHNTLPLIPHHFLTAIIMWNELHSTYSHRLAHNSTDLWSKVWIDYDISFEAVLSSNRFYECFPF